MHKDKDALHKPEKKTTGTTKKDQNVEPQVPLNHEQLENNTTSNSKNNWKSELNAMKAQYQNKDEVLEDNYHYNNNNYNNNYNYTQLYLTKFNNFINIYNYL